MSYKSFLISLLIGGMLGSGAYFTGYVKDLKLSNQRTEKKSHSLSSFVPGVYEGDYMKLTLNETNPSFTAYGSPSSSGYMSKVYDIKLLKNVINFSVPPPGRNNSNNRERYEFYFLLSQGKNNDTLEGRMLEVCEEKWEKDIKLKKTRSSVKEIKNRDEIVEDSQLLDILAGKYIGEIYSSSHNENISKIIAEFDINDDNSYMTIRDAFNKTNHVTIKMYDLEVSNSTITFYLKGDYEMTYVVLAYKNGDLEGTLKTRRAKCLLKLEKIEE